MKTEYKTIEEIIATVLDDIIQKGFSSMPPFSIGLVENRMSEFAAVNGIILASDELYMSSKQLQHCMRASKFHYGNKGERSDGIYIAQI